MKAVNNLPAATESRCVLTKGASNHRHYLMRLCCALLICLCWANQCYAANRDVCGGCAYSSIDAALSAAQSGDTIRIAGGSYSENLSIQRSNWNISLLGGYNNTFTDRGSETILNGYISVSIYNSGNLTIDGLTITNSSTQGVYINSPATNVTINDCNIHHNASIGIFQYSSGSLSITDNRIYSNGDYGGVLIDRYSTSGPATISNNTVYDHLCAYCKGIEILNATSSDAVTDNLAYSNRIGINVSSASISQAPIISGNTTYANTVNGITINSGSAIIRNNLSYRNEQNGIYYTNVGAAEVSNNTTAYNQRIGINFVSGSGRPIVRNNIAFENYWGIYFGDSSSFIGSSNVYPTEMSHNVLFGNILIHLSLENPVLSSEIPGNYGDINAEVWANSNMFIDPSFKDPENDDFRLSADSFLIDQGDDVDDYSAEPSPNGGIVNIGAQGNTSSAATTPNIPDINSLSATQDGSDLVISFATTTSLGAAWLTTEYWDGNSYQTIPTDQLSGDSISVGYQGTRIVTGNHQELRWTAAQSAFSTPQASTRIKVILSHGSQVRQAQSSVLNLNFAPSPSPSPTISPEPTSSATPEPSLSPSPSSSATPAASPTPEPSPQPKLAPEIVSLTFACQARGHCQVETQLRDLDSQSLRVQMLLRRGSKLLASSSLRIKLTNQARTIRLKYKKRILGRITYCVSATDQDSNRVESCKTRTQGGRD